MLKHKIFPKSMTLMLIISLIAQSVSMQIDSFGTLKSSIKITYTFDFKKSENFSTLVKNTSLYKYNTY